MAGSWSRGAGNGGEATHCASSGSPQSRASRAAVTRRRLRTLQGGGGGGQAKQDRSRGGSPTPPGGSSLPPKPSRAEPQPPGPLAGIAGQRGQLLFSFFRASPLLAFLPTHRQLIMGKGSNASKINRARADAAKRDAVAPGACAWGCSLEGPRAAALASGQPLPFRHRWRRQGRHGRPARRYRRHAHMQDLPSDVSEHVQAAAARGAQRQQAQQEYLCRVLRLACVSGDAAFASEE